MRRLSSQPHLYHCGRLTGRMRGCRRCSAGVNDFIYCTGKQVGSYQSWGPGKGVKFHKHLGNVGGQRRILRKKRVRERGK